MTDPLLRFRPEFPILERTTYLVSNSLGAMPRTVPTKLAEYANDWAELGVRAWSKGWWERPVTAGDAIAPLMNAEPGTVVMHTNVTIAQSTVLSALDFTNGRDTIVMTELDFPSVLYVYKALAPRFGARIVVVPSDDGLTIDQDRLLAAIDERTRIVAISHVLFKSAFIMDADAICARAHRMGALVSLDAYHSVGIIPVDVQRSQVDFLTGGVLKWLCGGPGAAFLYVSPKIRDTLAPTLTGWQAHTHPFAFEQEMDYTTGPFRWLNGTPNIPTLYIATEGPEIIKQATIPAIREKSLRQTSYLISLAESQGYPIHAPKDPARRGGTVAFDIPHAYEVAQDLIAQQILVDYRVGAGIRISPHFYTTDAELDHCVNAISTSLTSNSWQQFSQHRSVVT